MDSLRHPVGGLPAAVYWRRRLVVLAALVAVLALALYACAGSSGKKQPAGDTTPVGTTATATVGGTPSDPPSSPDATPPASADGGATSPGGGADTGQSGGQNAGATGSSGGSAGTTGAAGPCQLGLSMVSSAHAYINGEQPVFTVAVVNNGTTECTADLGPTSLVVTVYSGTDRIWSTADCGGTKHDLRAVAPKGVEQISITWPRTRSVPGCGGTATAAKVGTYYAQASLSLGAGTAQAATLTSSQQAFRLTTGS